MFFLITIIGIIFLLTISINLPFAHRFIAVKVNDIFKKSGIPVHIGSVNKILPTSISVQNISITGPEGDTIIFANVVRASFVPLAIFKKKVILPSVYLGNASVKLSRKNKDAELNIIEAFSSGIKDTVTKPVTWEVSVGSAELSQIQFQMRDSVAGIHINQEIREIKAKTKQMSLLKKTVLLQLLEVDGAAGSINIDPSSVITTATDSSLWKVGLSDLSLRDIKLKFNSTRNNIRLDLILGELAIKTTKTDFKNKIIEFNKILISKTSADLHIDRTTDKSKVKDSATNHIVLIPWNIKGDFLNIEDVNLKTGYYNDSISSTPAPAFSISNVDLNLADLIVNSKDANVIVKKGDFVLGNGFSLKSITGMIQSRNGTTSLDLNVETGNSILNINGSTDATIINLIEDPIKTKKATVLVKNTSLSLKDLFCFKPDLQKIPALMALSCKPFSVRADLGLEGAKARISNITINQDRNFGITLDGTIENCFETKITTGILNFKSTDIDIPALEGILKEAGVKYKFPEFAQLSFQGTVTDSLKSPHFTALLKSGIGNIELFGSYNFDKDSFGLKSVFHDCKLDKILSNLQFGAFSGSAEVSGFGLMKDSISAQANIKVDSLQFNGYTYSNANFNCDIERGKYDLQAIIKDPSLKMDLIALINTRDSMLVVSTTCNIQASLHDLHLYKDSLSVEGKITANFNKSKSTVESDVNILGLKLETPGDTALIKRISASLKADQEKTDLAAESDFFSITAKVGRPVSEFDSIMAGYRKYIQSILDSHNINSATRISYLPSMKASAKISFHQIFQLILKDTTLHFTNLNLQLTNNTSDSRINYHIDGKGIEYQMVKTNNLNANLVDSAGVLKLQIVADSCYVLSIPAGKILLTSRFENRNSKTTFSVLTKLNKVEYGFEVESAMDSNFVKINIPSKQLILNSTIWQLDTPEILKYNLSQKAIYPAIKMHTNNSFINLTTDTAKGIHLIKGEMSKVSIASLLRLDIIPGKPVGTISGSFGFEATKDQGRKINSDLEVRDISWSDLKLNLVTLKGHYISAKPGDYDIDMTARLDTASIKLTAASQAGKSRSVSAVFAFIPINTIQPFVKKFVSDLRGNVSGNFKLSTGNRRENITGELKIAGANARINVLNSKYKIPDEKVFFSDNKISFKNFKVLDSLNNQLLVNGSIDFADTRAIQTDLEIKASKLQVMDKPEDNNSQLYGQIYIDTWLTVKGPLLSPVLKGRILLSGGTEIFFRQKEDLSLTESANVLTFVSRKNATEQRKQLSFKSGTGYNKTSVETMVEIDPTTKIHVNLSKKMYNINLMIKGGGSLKYNMLSNSQVNLSGVYEVSEGTADIKMTGWPNKSFRITKGGYIRWQGEVEDPELKFEAVNRVRSSYTNPVDNKVRDVDFFITLKLSNRLTKLDVLFTINTPDQYLMSIINTLSPEEQMRQAITILLFGKIDLPGISTSSDYMTEQVNQLVATQLNRLTKTTIKGIDISFGIDSYVQSSQAGGQETKTSLSYEVKRALLNNRAQLEFSGRLNDMNKQPGASDLSLNNFSFEYRLDSSGTIFLKVYNEHTYEDVFEGEVVKTGVGLTYRKSYPTFGDIWKRGKKSMKSKNKNK